MPGYGAWPSIRDKPLKIPENWDGGVQIIGSGIEVTPSDNNMLTFEMATPDTVAWDHQCYWGLSIPPVLLCKHSEHFVRRQIIGSGQTIGSGLAVTPSDNIEMATPDTVAWDHDCLSLTSIPCSHSRRFVRRQIWSPTGIQGPICDPGKKGTPGWDGYPRTDTIIIENYYPFIHQF